MADPVKHYGKWRIRWIDENGQRKSKTYDKREDAKFWLAKHETESGEVKRHFRDPAPVDRRFDELCDKWLKLRSDKRSLRCDKSIIEVHLRKAFGGLLLRQIDIEPVADYIAERRYLDIKTVHNHLTLLISMLNLAVKLKWLVKVPDIEKPKIPKATFRFLKTTEEITRFLSSAMVEGEDVYRLYATVIYSGMRAGELAGLKWSNVNFEQRLITVENSFNGPTKNSDIHHVPILDVLLPILKELRLKRGESPYVFQNQAGQMHQASARIFQEILHRVLDRAKFPKIERRGKLRHCIVFHDLRHTFASHWMMRGGSIFKLREILGHKDIKMTMRYAHLAPNAFQEDFSRFGTESPLRAGSVVSFTNARNQ